MFFRPSFRFLSLLLLGLLIAPNAWSAHRSASVSWNRNPEPDVTGYRVYVGRSSGAYDEVFEAGNTTSFRLPGRDPETTYFVAVTAYRSSGAESELSTEVRLRFSDSMLGEVLPGAEPSVSRPTTFSAAIPGNSGLVGSVSIYWLVESGAGTVQFGQPQPGATSATFSAPGVYVLRAVATDGTTFLSDETTVRVLDVLENWLDRHGIPPEVVSQPGPSGRVPLADYASGIEPSATGTPPIALDYADGNLSLTFPRNRNVNDVEIVPEVSDSPAGPWTSGALVVAESVVRTEGDVDWVRATDRALSAPARFMRLRYR